MRLAVGAVFLLAVAARADAQEPDPGFASTLPAAVGDVSRWEVVTGEFESARMRGSYRFYVNPAREAMYQLMRYRVQLLGQNEDVAPRSPGERVAFVEHPGTRERMLIWAREATLDGPAWRPVVADTDEYKIELGLLMGVLAIHRTARAGPSP